MNFHKKSKKHSASKAKGMPFAVRKSFIADFLNLLTDKDNSLVGKDGSIVKIQPLDSKVFSKIFYKFYNTDTQQCNPSQRKIAEESKVHITNVNKAIKRLVDIGLLGKFSEWVEVKNPKRAGFKKQQTTNTYWIIQYAVEAMRLLMTKAYEGMHSLHDVICTIQISKTLEAIESEKKRFSKKAHSAEEIEQIAETYKKKCLSVRKNLTKVQEGLLQFYAQAVAEAKQKEAELRQREQEEYEENLKISMEQSFDKKENVYSPALAKFTQEREKRNSEQIPVRSFALARALGGNKGGSSCCN